MNFVWTFLNSQVFPEDGIAHSVLPYGVIGGVLFLFGFVLLATYAFDFLGVVAVTLMCCGPVTAGLAYGTAAYVRSSISPMSNSANWLVALAAAWLTIAGLMLIIARYVRRTRSPFDTLTPRVCIALDGAAVLLAINPILLFSLAADRQEYRENGFSYVNMVPQWLVAILALGGGMKIIAGILLWFHSEVLEDRLPLWMQR